MKKVVGERCFVICFRYKGFRYCFLSGRRLTDLSFVLALLTLAPRLLLCGVSRYPNNRSTIATSPAGAQGAQPDYRPLQPFLRVGQHRFRPVCSPTIELLM
jgi:hypothetical protein